MYIQTLLPANNFIKEAFKLNYINGEYIYGEDVYIDDYYMDEQWAYIRGFPEYMVSDKGRVWSVNSRRFLTLKPMDNHGHLGVVLYNENGRTYKYIHRLVAEAFIPNPNGYRIVRHIYDQPDQNTVHDLAWGTQRDNIYDAIANGTNYRLTDADRYKGNKKRMTSIRATDIRTGERLYFESQGEAARILRIPQPNIWKAVQGLRQTAGGYRFEVCR